MVPGPSPPHPPEGVAGRDAPADGRPEGASGAPPAQDDGIALEGLVPQGADLLPADRATAELATALGASYGLRAAAATHLATAVGAGADRFITNNRSDFSKSISEIAITYPEDLITTDKNFRA